jgi:chromosome segregation ATPase
MAGKILGIICNLGTLVILVIFMIDMHNVIKRYHKSHNDNIEKVVLRLGAIEKKETKLEITTANTIRDIGALLDKLDKISEKTNKLEADVQSLLTSLDSQKQRVDEAVANCQTEINRLQEQLAALLERLAAIESKLESKSLNEGN